jgi:membrane-bound serine protease (ClpP class)
MLFDLPDVSNLTVSFWSVLVPAVAGFSACALVVLYAVGRTLMRAQVSGVDDMVGKIGRTSTPLAPRGTVFVRGEYWTALADEEISTGEAVEVTAVSGMQLRVRRSQSDK